MKATARAFANIALAKYWGKADSDLNLPAMPSLSLTVTELFTTTTVAFDDGLSSDDVVVSDAAQSGRTRERVVKLLDRVRNEAGVDLFARVASQNTFPVASGLASSASGFAALAVAARVAAGLPHDAVLASRLARTASVSAARSVYGGFVTLDRGAPGDADLAATPVFDADYWDLRVVVALVGDAQKETSSTDGMERTRMTSPFYDAWALTAPRFYGEVLAGVRARDLERVGTAMEASTFAMHACAMASAPPVVYWKPPTLAIYDAVRALRARGTCAWATSDAGPHVKVFCEARDEGSVTQSLRAVDGVTRVLVAKPGGPATLEAT